MTPVALGPPKYLGTVVIDPSLERPTTASVLPDHIVVSRFNPIGPVSVRVLIPVPIVGLAHTSGVHSIGAASDATSGFHWSLAAMTMIPKIEIASPISTMPN